jgi:4-carboxymuconolactone decarboxylase
MTTIAKPAGLARQAADKPPRVAPITPETANEEQKALLAADPISHLNVIRTKLRSPELYKSWRAFSGHVLRRSSLPPRDRELLILRIGWLNQSQYEFTQHVRVAKGVGLTDAEIERLKAGADAPGWTPLEAALLRSADQLRMDSMIDDATWAELAAHYSEVQLLDVIATVGQYNMISWFLNCLRTPLEPGVAAHPMAD